MCIFSPKRPPHSLNLKNERKSLPSELLPEIINFLPLELKWSKQRVSLSFDISIFKTQSQYIISTKKLFYCLIQILTACKTHAATWNLRVIGTEEPQTLIKCQETLATFYGGLQQLSFLVSLKSPQFKVLHNNIVGQWFAIPNAVGNIAVDCPQTLTMLQLIENLIDALKNVHQDIYLAINRSNNSVLKLVKKAYRKFTATHIA